MKITNWSDLQTGDVAHFKLPDGKSYVTPVILTLYNAVLSVPTYSMLGNLFSRAPLAEFGEFLYAEREYLEGTVLRNVKRPPGVKWDYAVKVDGKWLYFDQYDLQDEEPEQCN